MLQYEGAIRDAHRAGAELSSALWAAQKSANLSPTAGHAVFAKVDQAQAQLSGSLASIATGHTLLKRLGDWLGAPTAYGPIKPPEERKMG